MESKFFFRCTPVLAVAIVTCVAFPVRAQVGAASITGSVTDKSGAAIAGVKVTVLEPSNNFSSTSETNSAGVYRVQSLLPGTCDVSFESPGFKRFSQKGLLLKVGDVLPVDGVLEIGNVIETVEVSAQGALESRLR